MIAVQDYNYLSFSNFQLLNFWDYYTLSSKGKIQSKYELVSLSQVLSHRKKIIEIDDQTEYKRCRVQLYGKGVVLRDEVLGKEIKTKRQQVCQPNDFLVAEIDAKFGGYGIVPKELEGAIVSSHYFLFDIDASKLYPEYLSLVLKCEGFSKQVKATGSTNYSAIRPYHVLGYVIPLPDIDAQKSLVKEYQSKINRANEMEVLANKREKEIVTFMNSQLGIDVKEKIEIAGLSFMRYQLIAGWGVGKAANRSVINYKKNYPLMKMKDVCNVGSGGTPGRGRKEYYVGDIPWVKTTEVRNEVILDTEEKINETALENSSAKLYPKDSLIVAMYGQGATRGRTAKLGIEAATNQACAVLYNIDNSRIDTDFLWNYLINEYDRLRELASGNNQPNLNAQMIKDYGVIVPPLNIQKLMLKEVEKKRLEIKKLQQQIEEMRMKAVREFEKEVFKN